jgi:HK97 family phage major capsid protein
MRDLKEIRERMGRLLAQCRQATEKMQAEPEKQAEHQAVFDKAFADFKKAKGEEQQALAEAELEREQRALDQPVNTIQTQGGDGQPSPKAKELHARCFNHFLRAAKGSKHERAFQETYQQLLGLEQHLHLGTVNDLGGFLVTDDFRNMMIQAMPGFAVVRAAGATVITTSSDRVKIPTLAPRTTPHPHVYTSGFVGDWKPAGSFGGSAAAPTVQNQPRFGQEEIPVHDWRPDALELDRNLIEDSAVNLEAVLARLFGQTKALDEDYEFLLGTGVGRPEGVLTAGITTVASGGAASLTYGGLVNLFTGLPAQYRQGARFVMNSDTFGKIIQLENTAGFLLFPPNAIPGTLFGKPVLFSEFLANVGAAAKPIIFGDWMNYYIVERADIRMQRLEERFAPNLGILGYARLGGQVTLTDAFRVQVVQA